MGSEHHFKGATVSQPPVSTAVNDNELSSLYGKTSSGKVFVVPKTADMLTALFFTTRSRTLFTKFTLLLIGLETVIFLLISGNLRRYAFLGIFLLWRIGYNGFLGYLLHKQSRKSYIVKALMRGGWLDEKYARGKWIRRELSVTMGPDYNFDAVPPEFNAWLLFRELVNLILANDFVCYIMFALSYFQARSDWAWWENLLRCVVAGLLIAFNVAVKLDAHRVVKDFAWYWGDFFFLVEQTLTFDGVFELAPHPMYSLGYAGYYGVALLTASSTVFYVSLMVHAAQFIFLVLVENPHIEKTYPSDAAPPALHPSEIHNTHHPRNLTLFERPDLHRAAGFFGVVVVGYGILLPLLCILQAFIVLPDGFLGALVLGHALAWRLLQTLGLGFLVLKPQSKDKSWTRHFIKTGGTAEEAFFNWRQIYSVVSVMSYVSFIGAASYHYRLLNSWAVGGVALRHTCGLLLVLLHVWTAMSVLEVVGSFGWFYGDFFLEHPAALRYTGIYRYLNNPENILGQAALYGVALMSASPSIFTLALASHFACLAFHYGVEAPHMRRKYGSLLRKQAGVSKTVRGAARSLTVNLAGARALDAVKRAEVLVDLVGQAVDNALGEAKARMPSLIKDNNLLVLSKIKLAEARNWLTVDLIEGSFLSEPVPGYRLSLLNLPESEPARYQMGQSIQVQVLVPAGQKLNWVGIYPVISNPSKAITTVKSEGRYLFTLPPSIEPSQLDQDDELPPERGPNEDQFYEDYLPWDDGYQVTLTFLGSRLPWKPGTYEFRCHRGQGYNVTCVSRPLEILAPSPLPRDLSYKEIAEHLLPYVARCMNLEPDLGRIEARMSSLTLLEASRIAMVIKVLFQVEFVANVILLHANIEGLSQRIFEARDALAPFTAVNPQSTADL